MFTYFKNDALKKLTLGFGNLFNNIYVGKYDSTGALSEKNRIPLTYSPKEKFIRRIQEPSTISEDTRTRITLPRMGFELLGMNYDPTRKINKLQKRFKNFQGETGTFNYAEVPYLATFGLYAFTRTIEENLEIVEQIVANFTPEFIISLNFNDINKKVNVPIVLTSTGMSELYEGSFLDTRTVTTTFSFLAKTYVYGPERNRVGGNHGGEEGGHNQSGSEARFIQETALSAFMGTTGSSDSTSEKISIFGVTGELGDNSIYGTGNTYNYYTDV